MATKSKPAPAKAAPAKAAAPKAAKAKAAPAEAEEEEVDETQEQENAAGEVEAEAPTEEVEQTLYEQVLEAARQISPKFATPHGKETEQAFAKRAMGAIADASDEQWDGLSEGVTEWYNAAVDCANEKKALPELTGFDDREVPKSKEAAPKAPKAAKAKKEAKEKGTGVTGQLRKLIVENLDKRAEAILELAHKAGIKEAVLPTVSTQRSNVMSVMQTLKAAGMLTKEAAAKIA